MAILDLGETKENICTKDGESEPSMLNWFGMVDKRVEHSSQETLRLTQEGRFDVPNRIIEVEPAFAVRITSF